MDASSRDNLVVKSCDSFAMLKECRRPPWNCPPSGHRIRHQRVAHGYTLDELGAVVGVAGSQLSLIENGKREPKLSLLQAIATATGIEVADLLSTEPPNRRAALEIELERAQSSSVFRQLGIAADQGLEGHDRRDDRVRSSACTASCSAASARRSRRPRRRDAPTPSCASGCASATTTCPTSRSSPRSS